MAGKRTRFIQRRKAVGHTQETLAEALGVDRTTIGRWESGRGEPQVWMRPKLAQTLQVSLDELSDLLAAGPSEQTVAVTPAAIPVAASSAMASLTEAVGADAADSALFLSFVSQTNVDDLVLEQLDADIARLAADYVSQPVATLFREISGLRRMVFRLLEGRQRPYQTGHLYLAAGRLCGLATHVALDLGQFRAASTHARTAWSCAESAGHNELQAWVRSIQSLIAYWQQDYCQAADLARDGLRYADGGTIRSRLLSLEARASAACGDQAGTLRAVQSAQDARQRPLALAELPGVFTFPEAKQWAYAGTALLALGSRQHVSRAIAASSQAITLYQSAPERDQSSGDLLASHLDLATAHLAGGDLDGARDKLMVVLEAAPERRTASISSRLHAFGDLLAQPAYARSVSARSLRDNLQEARRRPALTNLPEPAQ
ncbi:helix-turn-helix transcriptional regulator [Streptomyces sp. ISL-100]|uniref:helix-turn-helix transcriptional regulator n=1 Tax=Streptomyces sp. ISL-100 TaxID=2819173 RepID=UPI001BECDBC3|nr:helix-turn-helix transcriptional regulator [Streptomyces sp. ISL-100]MBT2401711.1 helix-turn-helix transcriptional regulator [Streptomyces sp. ISL-100]